MLNNPFIRDQAKRFAARLEAEVVGGDRSGDSAAGDRSGEVASDELNSEAAKKLRRARVTRGFEIALGRPPVEMEMQASLSFLTDESLADFCQVLFNLNEFLYLP